jgi:hypothetical protein
MASISAAVRLGTLQSIVAGASTVWGMTVQYWERSCRLAAEALDYAGGGNGARTYC